MYLKLAPQQPQKHGPLFRANVCGAPVGLGGGVGGGVHWRHFFVSSNTNLECRQD